MKMERRRAGIMAMALGIGYVLHLFIGELFDAPALVLICLATVAVLVLVWRSTVLRSGAVREPLASIASGVAWSIPVLSYRATFAHYRLVSESELYLLVAAHVMLAAPAFGLRDAEAGIGDRSRWVCRILTGVAALTYAVCVVATIDLVGGEAVRRALRATPVMYVAAGIPAVCWLCAAQVLLRGSGTAPCADEMALHDRDE